MDPLFVALRKLLVRRASMRVPVVFLNAFGTLERWVPVNTPKGTWEVYQQGRSSVQVGLTFEDVAEAIDKATGIVIEDTEEECIG